MRNVSLISPAAEQEGFFTIGGRGLFDNNEGESDAIDSNPNSSCTGVGNLKKGSSPNMNGTCTEGSEGFFNGSSVTPVRRNDTSTLLGSSTAPSNVSRDNSSNSSKDLVEQRRMPLTIEDVTNTAGSDQPIVIRECGLDKRGHLRTKEYRLDKPGLLRTKEYRLDKPGLLRVREYRLDKPGPLRTKEYRLDKRGHLRTREYRLDKRGLLSSRFRSQIVLDQYPWVKEVVSTLEGRKWEPSSEFSPDNEGSNTWRVVPDHGGEPQTDVKDLSALKVFLEHYGQCDDFLQKNLSSYQKELSVLTPPTEKVEKLAEFKKKFKKLYNSLLSYKAERKFSFEEKERESSLKPQNFSQSALTGSLPERLVPLKMTIVAADMDKAFETLLPEQVRPEEKFLEELKRDIVRWSDLNVFLASEQEHLVDQTLTQEQRALKSREKLLENKLEYGRRYMMGEFQKPLTSQKKKEKEDIERSLLQDEVEVLLSEFEIKRRILHNDFYDLTGQSCHYLSSLGGLLEGAPTTASDQEVILFCKQSISEFFKFLREFEHDEDYPYYFSESRNFFSAKIYLEAALEASSSAPNREVISALERAGNYYKNSSFFKIQRTRKARILDTLFSNMGLILYECVKKIRSSPSSREWMTLLEAIFKMHEDIQNIKVSLKISEARWRRSFYRMRAYSRSIYYGKFFAPEEHKIAELYDKIWVEETKAFPNQKLLSALQLFGQKFYSDYTVLGRGHIVKTQMLETILASVEEFQKNGSEGKGIDLLKMSLDVYEKKRECQLKADKEEKKINPNNYNSFIEKMHFMYHKYWVSGPSKYWDSFYAKYFYDQAATAYGVAYNALFWYANTNKGKNFKEAADIYFDLAEKSQKNLYSPAYINAGLKRARHFWEIADGAPRE